MKHCWQSFIVVMAFAASVFSDGNKDKIKALVAALSSPQTEWQDRMRAEKEAKELPASEVLPALLPEISKGMPAGRIWISAGPEFDKQAPPQWQAFYAVHRTWNHHLSGKPSAELGALLVGMLSQTATAAGELTLVRGLQRHWVDGAEEPLAKLFCDEAKHNEVRTLAAALLLTRKGTKYHGEVLKVAANSKGKLKESLWGILAAPSHWLPSGVDPAVVRMGFGLIKEEMAKPKPYIHRAYFIAVKLEDCVKQTFKPDQNDPKYKGPHGLEETFFSDTVSRALEWWSKNGEKFKGE